MGCIGPFGARQRGQGGFLCWASPRQRMVKKGGILMLPTYHSTSMPSEKPVKDFRSFEGNGNSNKRHDREKGVNVQVILRCRPLSKEELRAGTQVVINCNEDRQEITSVQNISNKQIDKNFAFDKVFGPTSEQKDLFDQAISPIVNEVLEGYNCTIFAYGQTGTGKTYTMEGGGGRKTKNGELPCDAGVIPRAVRQIFDVLEAQSSDYSMKVTFLELYNEEITDLLAPDESKFSDDKSKKPIALMEDGKGGVLVRGLEEEVVCSASEIYKILDKGSSKRRTAETLLNKQSSRSHSIFSITTHIKECNPEGEEMIKCGKLNLVDLAGSENISRLGTRDGRAREAGEINKSLLTLGRVINALVEHSVHVPYRDSKLTRLLRDSLGGKTKTCIIASISPSVHCLEETLSTLYYAHRAKKIKNKPEVNQKMKKAAMIKDLNFEIDRLKQDLYATREKNGVYIPKELYLHKESEKKAMTEKIECLELDLESKDKQLNGLQERFDSELQLNEEIIEKFEKKSKNLEDTKRAFLDLEEKYIQTNSMIKEMEYLISNLLKSEKDLVERVYELQSELETAAADISRMSSKIECKDKIEVGNKILIQRFRSELTQQLESLHRTVSVSVMEQEIQLKEMEDEMRSFISTKTKTSDVLRGRVEILKSTYDSGFRALDSLAGELDENSQSNFEKLNSRVLQHSSVLEDCFKEIALEADQLLNELQNSLSNQEDKLAVFAWQQREVHFRVVETTRSISKSAIYFFHTLDIHVSKVSTVLEESKTVQDKQLCELEKKFGEFSANEERQLLEKMMEMLASSSARKKKMVQMAVDSLRASAADRIDNLQSEVSSAQTLTSSIKDQWEVYMEETKIHYLEDTDAIESGRCSLKEGFQHCMATIKLASQQWRDAQKSLSTHGKTGVTSVDTVIRSGMEANRLLQGELCSTAATAIGEIDDVLSSIDCSSKLDHDVHTNVDSTIVSCRGELMELKSEHYRKTAEIIENAGKCFEVEYMVDEPSSSIPRRSIKFSSSASIDELRTPAFEELSKSFREARNQANGDTKHYLEAHESLQPQDFRDARIPLTAIN